MFPSMFVLQTVLVDSCESRWKKKTMQNIEFEQTTLNKCINKTCCRRVKKETKLKLKNSSIQSSICSSEVLTCLMLLWKSKGKEEELILLEVVIQQVLIVDWCDTFSWAVYVNINDISFNVKRLMVWFLFLELFFF